VDNNDWYEGIEKEISSLKEKMRTMNSSQYELVLLSRVAKRIAGFSSDCEHCQGHRKDISNLITNLGNLPMSNEVFANYRRTFGSITNHLEGHNRLHKGFSSGGLILIVVGTALFVWGTANRNPTLIYLNEGQIWGALIGIIGLIWVLIHYVRN
jgi:hypothetical protein